MVLAASPQVSVCVWVESELHAIQILENSGSTLVHPILTPDVMVSQLVHDMPMEQMTFERVFRLIPLRWYVKGERPSAAAGTLAANYHYYVPIGKGAPYTRSSNSTASKVASIIHGWCSVPVRTMLTFMWGDNSVPRDRVSTSAYPGTSIRSSFSVFPPVLAMNPAKTTREYRSH